MSEYEAAKGSVAPKEVASIMPNTWRWLCVRYFAECIEYRRLDKRTQHVRRQILEGTYEEPIAPGAQKFFRDMPLSRMTTDAIETLRDRKLEFPQAANGRIKAIRQVFRFGVKKKDKNGKPYAPSNSARDVEYFKTGSTGFYTWTTRMCSNSKRSITLGQRLALLLRC